MICSGYVSDCLRVCLVFLRVCFRVGLGFVSALRGSYGSCKGRCLGAHSGARHFTCKFLYRVALVKC